MSLGHAWHTLFMGTILLISFGIFGCSPNDCETYSDKVCEMACACTAGDQCAVASADGTVVYVYKDKSECSFFHKGTGCEQGGDPAFNFAACNTALETAECGPADMGGDAGSIESLLHPSCATVDAGQ